VPVLYVFLKPAAGEPVESPGTAVPEL